MTQNATRTLDAKGLSCPQPIMMLAKLMKEMTGGERLEIYADDPGALEDIPAWCRRTGNELCAIEEREGIIKAIIKKL
jgi:tRNA 2-thiouridine synthesizing protein A